MKNEFISMVNHEIRTPLTAIQGSLDLLVAGVAGDVSGDAHELLEIARNNGKRLIRLINDILDVEKIESGKMEFKLAPVEISGLVYEAVEMSRLYGKNFGVTIKLVQDLPSVRANVDSDRLIQVLTNLLSNAIKFSPRGEEIAVAIEKREEYVRVSVTDHGPGIPEDFQAKVFEKFSQADNSITRERGGTGLGLSICKAICEKLNGTINFTTSSKGTTFYFELPIWY
jgi:signal transduction histidine kinase